MTLLKGDDSLKNPQAMPTIPAGPAYTIMDGWRLGIGFWLALILAIPVILFILVILFWILIIIFGNLAGGLL
jgi:hypothetical protein